MIQDTVFLIGELLLLFFSVAFGVHITQRWLGEERLRRWMGGSPVVAALKGIGVGFITPFCTYSAIPMLIGLRRAGVEPAGYVAFIVAAPVLDPVLFGALVLIVGLPVALVYGAVAFAAAMGLALIAQRVGIERFMRPLEACTQTSCVEPGDRGWRGWRMEAPDASRAALSLLETLAPVLLLGVGIGVAIQLLAPADFVASVAGPGNPLAIPAAAGLGTPLYFNTELFVPIANSLAAVGVGIGAIVALTIAGAGANVPEFVILSRLARGRVLVVFIGYVFLVAIAGGLLAQTVV